VILDNLSANKTPAIRRWAQRENVELCFTPTCLGLAGEGVQIIRFWLAAT
jgi:hypothetical protein